MELRLERNLLPDDFVQIRLKKRLMNRGSVHLLYTNDILSIYLSIYLSPNSLPALPGRQAAPSCEAASSPILGDDKLATDSEGFSLGLLPRCKV